MIQYNSNMQIFSTILYALAIVGTLVIYHFFKDKDEKKKNMPLYIIGIILIVLEIIKQLNNALGYDYADIFALIKGKKDEFTAYAFPFHFCSFFIFWIIFQFIFFKNEKLRMFFGNMAFLWSLFVTALIILYPDMIYGGAVNNLMENGVFEHTILFHSLVVFYFAFSVALRTYKFNIKRIYEAPLCIAIFGVLAIPAAHIFKENYCSIYSCEGWGFLQGVFDMGYVVYDGVLVIIGIVLSSLLYLEISFAEKLRNKVKNNKLYLMGYAILVPALVILLVISKATSYTVLQPLYSIYIILLAFVVMIPALIKGHILRK